ncbi:MAG: hypothetical protein IJ048_05010 [Clostridia bacterium]|nr:hypothetical protein [Clostridia bacterium]
MDELLRICRVSADYLDTAAFSTLDDEDSARLDALAAKLNVGLSIMDAEGVALYDSRRLGDIQRLAEGEELEEAQLNGTGSDVRDYLKTRTMYVAVRSDSGLIVRLWRPAPDGWAMLKNYRGRLILMGLLLTAICFTAVSLLVRESDKLVQGTQRILDAFAEGRFDERIEYVFGRNAQWARRINASAARISEQLKRRNSRNQALSVVMNQMQNGMLAVNSALQVILMTPVAKTLLGVHEQAEGLPVSSLNKDVNLEPIFLEAMGQPGVYTSEIAVREGRTGRGHTPLRLYISPMQRDGEVVGAMAMIEDITELRRLEQMRTDFTANVSHELKTPLTSIRGFVETLLDGAIDNPEMARKFLNIIMMEANRLTRLVNDILSISKLEAGDTEVSLGRLRLDKMASDVCEMLQIHAKEKQIDLSINENDEPIYVWGNQDRLEQLVLNLVENAIKYNQPGGSVRVSVYGTAENAYFLVSDTGIGIAEEHLPRLFERFYRVDKGRSRSMGGTGLGLAIVKHIAVSMGGTVEVHSKLGEGSEFSVTLPRYVAKEEEEEKPDDNYEGEGV